MMTSRLAEIFSKRGSQCDMCKVLETVIDEILEPIVLVDDQGMIMLFNKAYSKYLNIPRSEALGKPVTEVIDNTRLHIICLDKVMEIDRLQNIKGKQAVVHRIPVFLEKEFVGAIGKVNFRDITDVEGLMNKVDVLSLKVEKYKHSLKPSATYTFDDIIGSSTKSLSVKEQAQKIAKINSNVLIQGETGVGKELFAHSIHNASTRQGGPFISINCAAIPQELLEAELFGYAEGAFTGAKKNGKVGKFELADGGTAFLDEVGDMSLRMQSKLLRVLQDKQVEKLGGTEKKKIDVRVIAASNLNLEKAVDQKIFRADLYYRLSTLSLKIPPLRERIDDIYPIIDHLVSQLNASGNHETIFSTEALELMALYHWPGNVRELVNIVERLLFLEEANIFLVEHVKKALNWESEDLEGTESSCFLEYSVFKAEKEAIVRALSVARGNKARAAKILGIHRTTLYQKMQRCGINVQNPGEE